MTFSPVTRAVAACALSLGLAGAASAATFDVNTAVTGYYQQTANGAGTSPNTNALIEDGTRNNYLTFDLSGVTGTVTSAVLTIFASGNYSNSTGGQSINYTLYDVTTPVSVLNDRGGYAGVFEDLASGNSYGSVDIATPGGFGAMPEIVLSLVGNAVTDINAALAGDGLFAIGGNSSLAANQGFLWISAFGWPAAKLTLTTETAAVPVPASLPLLGAGLAAFGLLRRKRK